MIDVRWNSPFPYTLAFNLFRKHITELNGIYWSFVPVSNTIISYAKRELQNDDADPKKFFLVHDEDDKRIARTYKMWKDNFREFGNYTRLNMVMLISSCFETYLRTVVSTAFESKPGIIIMCPDAVDGAFLLKNKLEYGNSSTKNYQFTEYVDDICRGTWDKRFSAFEKYFGPLPHSISLKKTELDELRTVRNNIGHYFGRKKDDYSTPLFFSPISAMRISHNKILKYFKLVNDVAKQLDLYLKEHYIGSYDIIKCYYQHLSDGFFNDERPGMRARKFQQLLGAEGLPLAGKEYYSNLINYCELDHPSASCRYSISVCIKEINRQLMQDGKTLTKDGRKTSIKRAHFKTFIHSHNWNTDDQYCQKVIYRGQSEYRYSEKAIEGILKEIYSNPESIVGGLRLICNTI